MYFVVLLHGHQSIRCSGSGSPQILSTPIPSPLSFLTQASRTLAVQSPARFVSTMHTVILACNDSPLHARRIDSSTLTCAPYAAPLSRPSRPCGTEAVFSETGIGIKFQDVMQTGLENYVSLAVSPLPSSFDFPSLWSLLFSFHSLCYTLDSLEIKIG